MKITRNDKRKHLPILSWKPYKCPGVRPIGVGEVVRRIIGKAVLATVKMDILEATGPLQLCAGQDAG